MFDSWFLDRAEEVGGWLRHLHAHPELSFQETATAAFVAERLRAFGVDVHTGIGGTGVVGVLRGAGGGGRTIGLRAELDALPIIEKSGIDYRSNSEGVFHGCGHDGHSVTLLTTAAYLAQHRDFAGTAVFIFQPAEETLGGARAMISDGLFERFHCDEIYALHNIPGMREGHIGVVRGGALASADIIRINVHANGTHGSAPHTGADGVMAAAAFLTSFQQSLTRVIDSRESGVVSFGKIAGGVMPNVLPELVQIEGTIRAHTPEIRERIIAQARAVARSMQDVYGVRIDCSIEATAPATINDPHCVDGVLASAARVAGADRIEPHPRPVMAAEDFSLMLQQRPGAYFFIGQNGEYCHHPEYVFDAKIIPLGAAIFADLVRSRASISTF